MEPQGNTQTIQAIAKVTECFLQIDEALLPKATHLYLTENRKVKLVPDYRHGPYWSVFIVPEGRHYAHYLRRKDTANPATHPEIYNDNMPADMLVQ